MGSAFNRDEQVKNQHAKIIVGIERISTVFRAALWDQAKQYGISPLQVQILLFVAFHDVSQCSITSLAKEFAVTKATISDAVRVLLEKSFLKKVGADGARGFNLSLDESGQQCVQKLGLSKFFEDSLVTAGKDEIDKIWEGLLLLINILQNTNVIPMRMCFNCKNFGKDHPDGKPHYCYLMKKPLEIRDIRIDCPEHLLVV